MLVRLAIAIAGPSIPAMISAAPAGAATNGSSPHATRCDADAISLHTYGMPDPQTGAVMGYSYLRYSPTCQTEWVTVNYNSGYYPEPSVWVQNQSGTNLYTAGDSYWGGKVWTNQLADMRYRTACGGVQMYRTYNQYVPSRGAYMGWFYLGCA